MRCPNYSPGNELRCEHEQGHPGEHHARRPEWSISNPRYVMHWNAPDALTGTTPTVIDITALLEDDQLERESAPIIEL